MSSLRIHSKIDEIWVKQTCTTLPQKDTPWVMFGVFQVGLGVQYSPAIRYEIQMCVKKHKHKNGDEIPYTREIKYCFHIDSTRDAQVAFVMVNHADRPIAEIEGHLKDLLLKFNATEMDSFQSDGTRRNDLLPLGLEDVIARNLTTFDLPGFALDAGKAIASAYFTNKDAPIAYDRVTRWAGRQSDEERYARDYIGPNSRYGVAWKVGAA